MPRPGAHGGDSVFDEPHLRAGPHAPDPSERAAAAALSGHAPSRDPAGDQAARSVWDEPTTSAALSGAPPEEAVTYSRWLASRMVTTPAPLSWLATLAVAAIAGPLSIFGAIAGQLMHRGGAFSEIAGAVFIAPLIEETMKAVAMLYVIEKWPYLFRSGGQIILCGLAAGFAFAAVENVIYLRIYIPDASPSLAAWRWTVCVAMHAGCTLIVSLGLLRMWRRTTRELRPPELADAAPYFVAGAAVHAVYNASVIAAALLGWEP